jgi:hypothetical protein
MSRVIDELHTFFVLETCGVLPQASLRIDDATAIVSVRPCARQTV